MGMLWGMYVSGLQLFNAFSACVMAAGRRPLPTPEGANPLPTPGGGVDRFTLYPIAYMLWDLCMFSLRLIPLHPIPYSLYPIPYSLPVHVFPLPV